MIIETAAENVFTNIDDEFTRPMRISAEGLAHVMTSLTILYKDPQSAAIREYTANAFDSHTRAGQTLPVTVTLPTHELPIFTVEDFGVGMNREEIDNIYADYGASSKRKTNNEIGAFGFGAKSALGMANQFTLRSVKDGQLVNVLLRKSPDGHNSVTILPAVPTDLPNGVKVSIPVDTKDIWSFHSKAKEVFRFVNPDRLLVDGVRPTTYHATTDLVFAKDGFMGYFARTGHSHHVVMGGVGYALSTEDINASAERIGIKLQPTFYGTSFVLVVPVGSVSLTPNRESLRFEDTTKDVLDKALGQLVDAITAKAQAEIDAIEDRSEVVRAVKEWNDAIGLQLQWKGEDVLYRVESSDGIAKVYKNTSWDRNRTHRITYSIDTDRKAVVVSGTSYEKYRKLVSYLGDFLAARGLGATMQTYFTDDEKVYGNPWIADNPKITLVSGEQMMEEVRAYRKQHKASRPSTSKPKKVTAAVEYLVLDIATQTVTKSEASDLDPVGTYYLQQADQYQYIPLSNTLSNALTGTSTLTSYDPELRAMHKSFPEVQRVVFIPTSRKLEVFLNRASFDVPELRQHVKAAADALRKRTSDDQRLAKLNWVESGYASATLYKLVQAGKLRDKEIREIYTFPAKTKALHAEVKRMQAVLQFVGIKAGGFIADMQDSHVYSTSHRSTFAERYPLLKGITRVRDDEELEHIQLYMNTVYAKLVKQAKS